MKKNVLIKIVKGLCAEVIDISPFFAIWSLVIMSLFFALKFEFYISYFFTFISFALWLYSRNLRNRNKNDDILTSAYSKKYFSMSEDDEYYILKRKGVV